MADKSFWESFWELCRVEGVQAAIDMLQHSQIDINKVNGSGRSALTAAVWVGSHEGLAALLAQDQLLATTINHRNSDGLSPIMYALHWNQVECFHLLLTDPKVDLDTRDNHQRTPQEVRG